MWTITVHVYELCKCYTIMYNDNNVMYHESRHGLYYFNFNFNFILPKVNTDYMRQAQVLNIDKLRLTISLRKFNENVK